MQEVDEKLSPEKKDVAAGASASESTVRKPSAPELPNPGEVTARGINTECVICMEETVGTSLTKHICPINNLFTSRFECYLGTHRETPYEITFPKLFLTLKIPTRGRSLSSKHMIICSFQFEMIVFCFSVEYAIPKLRSRVHVRQVFSLSRRLSLMSCQHRSANPTHGRQGVLQPTDQHIIPKITSSSLS